MWVWLGVAWAGEATVDQALEMGLPRQHTPLASCDCVDLTWADDGVESHLRLGHADLKSVTHDVRDDVHHLGLRLADERVVWLESAPCPIIRPMVETYAGAFGLPIEGSGVEVACVDVAAQTIAYQTSQTTRFVAVKEWNEAPLAMVRVVNDRAEAEVDLQGRFSNARPLLGACFETGEGAVERHVVVTGLSMPDGRWKKLAVSDADAVSSCVLTQVGAVAPASRPKKAKVSIDVSWAPPAETP
ncbi:MAG: hypothetical protein KC621_05055 [Myxococcales bacterium]|nr:hypothetical protein [Myxococcales bacterium]